MEIEKNVDNSWVLFEDFQILMVQSTQNDVAKRTPRFTYTLRIHPPPKQTVR
jgi:hypothetical protein